MKRVEEKLFAFIKNYDLIKQGEKLLVGFSGGPDSVFCLSFLDKYRKKYKIDLAAVHVNHMIRRGSLEDVKFCKQFCDKKNIPIFIESVSVSDYAKKNKLSIEEAGRILRYEIFSKISFENSFDKIVTAHNLDDNAETVLLNLIKGSGINGLKGIPPKRGNIIRPILCLSKSEILEYLSSRKIEFATDESNSSNDYQRNFLRNEIIPKLKNKLNPIFAEAVFRLSQNATELSNYLENDISEFVNKKIRKKGSDYLIRINDVKKLHQIILGEVIRKFFNDFLKVGFVKADLTKIQRLIANQKGKSESLKDNWIIQRESDCLYFTKQLAHEEKNPTFEKKENSISVGKMKVKIEFVKPDEVKFNNSGKEEFVDAGKLDDNFVLRKWKAGDKFVPLGMKNSKKISDFLSDLKLSTTAKKNTYLLLNRNNIVWVVGLRISEEYRITSRTKKIIKLTVN